MTLGKVFICGCGHSGTTLLATILSTHADVFVPFEETNVFFKWTPLALLRYGRLKRAARGAGKSILIEKTPRHIRRVEKIRRLVPDAKFVMPVRDGRDVVASLAKRLGDPAAGLERWIGDNGLVLAERGKPDVHVYRYEDFVEDPAGVLAGICAFIGVDYRESLLRFHENPIGQWGAQAPDAAGNPHVALRNSQVRQPIYDGRGRWRTELGAAELAALTEGPGLPLMKAFGYL
jgi:hypothetical protein